MGPGFPGCLVYAADWGVPNDEIIHLNIKKFIVIETQGFEGV